MSDTMRDAFEAWMIETGRQVQGCYWSESQMNMWAAWQAAQSQPAPPVPSSVQEILNLLNPYVRACMMAGHPHPKKDIDEARLAECDRVFKPLEAALTALVDDNHRLRFELDGVRAMRGPLTEGEIHTATGASDVYWAHSKIWILGIARAIEKAHGIEPEQGGNHG